MFYGGYTLDCYCDTLGCKESTSHATTNDGRQGVAPLSVVAETGSECRMIARRRGWTFVRNECFCPKCTNEKRERKARGE